MSLDFTAIDFETANSSRASACAIGLVKFRNGVEVERIAEIFKPPAEFNYFDPWNVMIHGISSKDVKNKKSFGDLWPEFNDFINEDLVVAHNASFDFSVLRHSLSESGLAWPKYKYLCSMILSKPVYPLTSYSLPIVAKASGINFSAEKHHDASYDAWVSAQIILKIAQLKNSPNIYELCEKLSVNIGTLDSEGWNACRIQKSGSKKRSDISYDRLKASEIEINLNADPDHPLFDKFVAFTGTLSSLKRIEAWQIIANLGGIPEENVTKSTNILVVGEQDPTKFRLGDTTSSKYQKAEKLRLKGQEIEVIFERDFLSLLEPVKG